jgi:peptide/nickel transport system substrate-binding protein
MRSLLAACACLGVAAALPAAAQKSQNTLRLALNDLVPVIDTYTLGAGEAATFKSGIYETLIVLDERKGTFEPQLAKSYKRIDNVTLEFDLKQGVKFHNGNRFDAQDVKYTLDYLRDPASKVQFKGRYNFIKSVEVLSPYKVRVTMVQPYATDLSAFAYLLSIYDAETYEALDNKADYGRTANGTGPYKLVYIDRNNGIMAERVSHPGDDPKSPHDRIKRIHGIPIPDAQTRIAQILTGGVDVLRRIGPDEARELSGKPGIATTLTPGGILMYVTLDAIGRSPNKVMTDERVRKAFIMAIDVPSIVKNLVPGGDRKKPLTAICFKPLVACAPSEGPYPYNPSEAKRLLAEAGYPDGFDLTLHTYVQVRDIGEAIAGELRKVGIRASVEALPSSVYVKKRSEGDFTAFVGTFPTDNQPDTANLWDFFFAGDRDYWHDDVIHKIAAEGGREVDVAKRTALYTPALDRVNERAYILPIIDLPVQWAHGKDVQILENPHSVASTNIGDFAWK